MDPATFLEVASCLRSLCLASLKFLPWTWRLGHKTDCLGDTRIIPMMVVAVVLGCASHLRSGLYNPYMILPIFHPIYQWGYSIYNWGITTIYDSWDAPKKDSRWMNGAWVHHRLDPNVEPTSTVIHLGNSHLTSQKKTLPHKMHAIKLKVYSQSIFTIISGEVLCCQCKLFKYIHI